MNSNFNLNNLDRNEVVSRLEDAADQVWMLCE